MDWDYDTAILATGSSFGEIALLGDGYRVATAKCLTNCYMA